MASRMRQRGRARLEGKEITECSVRSTAEQLKRATLRHLPLKPLPCVAIGGGELAQILPLQLLCMLNAQHPQIIFLPALPGCSLPFTGGSEHVARLPPFSFPALTCHAAFPWPCCNCGKGDCKLTSPGQQHWKAFCSLLLFTSLCIDEIYLCL